MFQLLKLTDCDPCIIISDKKRVMRATFELLSGCVELANMILVQNGFHIESWRYVESKTMALVDGFTFEFMEFARNKSNREGYDQHIKVASYRSSFKTESEFPVFPLIVGQILKSCLRMLLLLKVLGNR
ncbi:unnamed protein product [Ambrosiozyma monospora]|uniref:Unnamed protein product n=1 Tax=Ambrosiozyma monospora TaxID=43982 RepID=A0ACB5SYC3_AMBMO|nr:unnamed protein product [Ambrosiozyma monospora]